jgi:transposase
MNKITKFSAKTLIAAADVSKGKHTGYFRTIEDDTVKPFVFSNTLEGFNEFLGKIMRYKEKHKLEEIIFGCESTGSYGFPLLQFMERNGAETVQVNPKHTKRIKEIIDNSPNKTDGKDPKVIAELILYKRYLQINLPEGLIADLRCKVTYRENLLEDITRVENRLEGLIAQFFPELLTITKNFKSKTAKYLLEHYPTPSGLLAIGKEQLSKELQKVSRGKFGIAKANDLIDYAGSTIGIKEGVQGYSNQINCYVAQLKLLNGQLKEKEAEIDEILNRLPVSKLLLSMKGLGRVTVAILISEIVDFNNFTVIPEILKYAGMNLFEISSGKKKGQKKISKRGRSLIRKALYFASLGMVRKGGNFHEDYKRLLSRGMKPTKALVAISRKLLRVLFAMVRDNREFIRTKKEVIIKTAA